MHPVCQVDLPHGHEVGPRLLRLHPRHTRHWRLGPWATTCTTATSGTIVTIVTSGHYCDYCDCSVTNVTAFLLAGTTAVRWLLRQVKLGTYRLMKAFDIINGNDNNTNKDNQHDTSFLTMQTKHYINQHIENFWVHVVRWVGMTNHNSYSCQLVYHGSDLNIWKNFSFIYIFYIFIYLLFVFGLFLVSKCLKK